ncbi:MAG: hypothetical protein HOW97_23855 [Catenulispora sp.]|nr:hypothetical protein [Catenulispora sp.]
MSSTSAVAVLAQGLRDLRDFADGPDPAELSRRTGLTEQQIDAALAGKRLPTREVTLALVGAWEGDVEAWREYWGQIAELVRDEKSTEASGGAVPVAPEPSIITALPSGEQAPEGDAETEAVANAEQGADEAEQAAGTGVGAEPVVAEASQQDVAANAEHAAKENEQTGEAETSAEAVEGGAATVVADDAQSASVDVPESEAAAAASETASSGQAASAATQAATASESTAAASEAAPSEQTTPAEGLHPVVLSAEAPSPSGDRGAPPESVKKGVLARAGIPVLVFVVGVAVGAFGDHAFSSKSSATPASASLPSASQSQSHAAQPTTAGTSATRGVSSSSAAVPGGSGTSSTSSSASASASTSESASESASVSSSGSDSASSGPSVAPGTTLGTYRSIQLPSAYSVDFLHDTYHPVSGTANGPDTMGFYATSFVDGTFYADKAALLDPQETGDYSSCLDDTRYQKDVLLSKVSAGSQFCVHTSTGHLVLVTVQRMPSSTDANPYAVVDLTVWQE